MAGSAEAYVDTSAFIAIADRSDAFGLHAMQERGVRVCWSTDFHLGLMGVPLAIHARGG